ncbi:MAG TPA: glycosyltransferase [Ignavibacteriales bacterium]|nr:glycosyltransferase [Ignavibacteriales bacterium]
MPKITIVIPTYNNLEELKKCLESLSKQTIKDFNVYICIDGSTDGTLEYLKQSQYSFEIKIFEHPDKNNHGRATTRNLIINHINSTYIIFLDSDTFAKEDLVENHIKLLESNKNCISSGSVFYINEKTNLIAYYLNRRGKNNLNHLENLPPQYFTTQNFAMHSNNFIETQGFNEIFDQSYGGEDTEFAVRLTEKHKFKIINNHNSLTYSIMEKSIKKFITQMYNFGYTNLHLLVELYPKYNFFKTKRILYRNKNLTKLFLKFNNILSIILKYYLTNNSNGWYKIKYYILHYLVWEEIIRGYFDKINMQASKIEIF